MCRSMHAEGAPAWRQGLTWWQLHEAGQQGSGYHGEGSGGSSRPQDLGSMALHERLECEGGGILSGGGHLSAVCWHTGSRVQRGLAQASGRGSSVCPATDLLASSSWRRLPSTPCPRSAALPAHPLFVDFEAETDDHDSQEAEEKVASAIHPPLALQLRTAQPFGGRLGSAAARQEATHTGR